jgi:hypothetical protein
MKYRVVKGYFNPMGVCDTCDKDATVTLMTYTCVDLHNKAPVICDDCRPKALKDDVDNTPKRGINTV